MTITEVSEKLNLSQDTLRYYERIGLIPRVRRNKSGVRDYEEKDLAWAEFAKCMRSAGIPVETLIDYVQMFLSGDATRAARKELLIEQRDRLTENIKAMQSMLERLNHKIENYDGTLQRAEQALQ